MAGVYVHVPFCRKACHYCNFHFSTTLKQQNDFVDALLKEITLQQNYLADRLVETIYFGGGTPSLLSISQLNSIMNLLRSNFTVHNNAEITLEANPDDISESKLIEWKQAGINRLSIGIQSFFDTDLQWMNRAHSSKQASESVLLAKQNGFDNITIDLIYGTPTLSDENWKHNIETALSLRVPHISCYALTVEPSTALRKMIDQKKLADVDPEKQARHFLQLIDALQPAGFEHYEISNFAKPGHRSRHNTSYWQQQHYLGLGPSAHSFNGSSRQWNIANNSLYIQSLQQHELAFEIEHLTPTQQLNEYIMTALRTMEGLSLEYVRRNFGDAHASEITGASASFIAAGKLVQQADRLILTKTGKLFADGIASDLFFIEPEMKNED